MHVERTDSCPPVQPPCLEALPGLPAGQASGRLRDHPEQRLLPLPGLPANRVQAGKPSRQAAMRLLIAAHPEEWVGLLGLVRAGRQAATNYPTGGGRGA